MKKKPTPKRDRLWVPGQRSLAPQRFKDATKYTRRAKHPKRDED